MAFLGHSERKLAELGIPIPPWIEQDITASGLSEITRKGLWFTTQNRLHTMVDSREALAIMNDHGDAVLSYLRGDVLKVLPGIPDNIGWAGLAAHYLAAARLAWAFEIEDLAQSALDAQEHQAT